jgi:hypothetical protein
MYLGLVTYLPLFRPTYIPSYLFKCHMLTFYQPLVGWFKLNIKISIKITMYHKIISWNHRHMPQYKKGLFLLHVVAFYICN